MLENNTPYSAPRRSATTSPLRALSQLGATILDTVNEILPQTASTLSSNSVGLAPPLPPAYVLGSQQRGGFREAYGDPPRCSPELHRGVLNHRHYFRKLKQFLL